jgi:hypothetical protein
MRHRRGASPALAAALAIVAACAGAATAVGAGPGAHHRAPRSVTIQWVGDIAFGESFGLPAGGLSGALAPVRRYLEQANLTIGNLEGTIASGGTSKCASIGPSEC